MRMRLAVLALLTSAVLGMSGCMTILAPPRQNVYVETDPPGASVSVGGQTFTSPGIVVLDTRNDWDIEASAPGYQAQTAILESHMSGGKIVGSVLMNAIAWGWWTFGVGLVAGVAIDFGSGSLEELEPTHLHMYMQTVPGGPRDYSRPPPTAQPARPAGPAPPAIAIPPAAATGRPPAQAPPPDYDPWHGPPAGTTQQATFCRNCGRKLNGDEVYCPSCGQKVH